MDPRHVAAREEEAAPKVSGTGARCGRKEII